MLRRNVRAQERKVEMYPNDRLRDERRDLVEHALASPFGAVAMEDLPTMLRLRVDRRCRREFAILVGAAADLACWSLYAAKNIGTGEGGMVTTDNDGLAERVRMVRTHGEKVKYSSLMLGTNYRMSEIQAAIVLSS